MDIQSIKIDLIHWLTEVQDESILKQLQAFKQQQEHGLSDAHKTLLNERVASYKNDPSNLFDWDNVMNGIEKGL